MMNTLTRSDFEAALRDDMRAHGLEPPDEFDWSGGFKRFSTNPARPWDTAGYVLVHWDERPNAMYGCFRSGERHLYVPEGVQDMLPEERRAALERIEAAKAKRLQAERKRQQNTAVRCASMYWEKNAALMVRDVPKTHPYLRRKKIPPVGARMRVKDRALALPITDLNGRIWSLQWITETGEKRFAPGGKIKGNMMILGEDLIETSPVIWITEGWATAVSIIKATSLPVVVAFSAGNIKAVAQKVRKKFGADRRIIIAADNDAGTPGNPGVRCAREAAAAIGGLIAVPTAPAGVEGSVDWNDIWVTHGAVRTMEMLEAAVAPAGTAADPESISEPVIQVPAEDDTQSGRWKSALICDDRGRIKPLEANAALMLQHDPELKGLVRWDSFSGIIEIVRRPPWLPHAPEFDGRYPRQMIDKDRASLLMYLQRRGIHFSRRQIDEALRGLPEWASYDPLAEMLHNLEWDGRERLSRWLVDYCGAEDSPYTAAVGRAFLIGAVARGLDPGCKMDSTLVLEGYQGSGKSSLARLLALRPDFASDAFPNLRTDKFPELRLKGVWIMEVPELSGVSKADVNAVKEFLSRQEDRARDPYGATVENRPRRCVFVCTTNQSEYMRDPTGARRFWPIATRHIKLADFARDVAQIMAEAVVAYKAGEKSYLDPDAQAAQRETADERQILDPLCDMIASYVREHRVTGLSPAEILYDVMADRERSLAARLTVQDSIRAAAALTQMGWIKVWRTRWCKREIGSRVDIWIPKQLMEAFAEETGTPHKITLEQAHTLKLNARYYEPPAITQLHQAAAAAEAKGFHAMR